MHKVLVLALITGVFALPAGGAHGNEQATAIQLAQSQQGPAGEVEGQIADFRRRLSITPAQQAQFEAVAQAMRQNAREMDALVRQAQAKGKPNAVDAVRGAGQFSDAEAAGMKRLLAPLQVLYDSLSDQQKRAADQVFATGPEALPAAPQQPPQAQRR